MQNSHCQLISNNNPNFFWQILGKVAKALTPVYGLLPSISPTSNLLLDTANMPLDSRVHSPLYSYFEDTLPYVAANEGLLILRLFIF